MISASTVFLLVVLFKVIFYDKVCEGSENGLVFRKALKGWRLENNLLKTVTTFSVAECSLECLRSRSCKSLNYAESLNNIIEENCELNDAKASTNSDDLARNDLFNHCEIMETKHVNRNLYFLSTKYENDECKMSTDCGCPSGYRGEHCCEALGSSNDFPGKSCKDIKQRLNTSISKEYWIKPTLNGTAFLVYCEMKKEGGGWTLVYSYTFNNYKDFYNVKNAVTPRPNWSAPSGDVNVSTEPPSKDKFGAIQFHLWKEIGEDFFITSNINDWYRCKPITGSLVEQTSGSISCQHVKDIAENCNDTATPTHITWEQGGPVLQGAALITVYRFDGNRRNGFPTHNSCVGSTRNHKTGVDNPQGRIFVRQKN